MNIEGNLRKRHMIGALRMKSALFIRRTLGSASKVLGLQACTPYLACYELFALFFYSADQYCYLHLGVNCGYERICGSVEVSVLC